MIFQNGPQVRVRGFLDQRCDHPEDFPWAERDLYARAYLELPRELRWNRVVKFLPQGNFQCNARDHTGSRTIEPNRAHTMTHGHELLDSIRLPSCNFSINVASEVCQKLAEHHKKFEMWRRAFVYSRAEQMDWIQKRKWWLFLIILLGTVVALFERWQFRREHSQDKVILAAASRYGMDAALIKAVVWRESRFNPRVTGQGGGDWPHANPKDGRGGMGRRGANSFVLPPTAFRSCKERYGRDLVIKEVAGRYSRTDNPLPYALADYNAGRSHVLKWNQGAAGTNSGNFIEQIEFPGTKDYVRSIMRRYNLTGRFFHSAGKRPKRASGRTSQPPADPRKSPAMGSGAFGEAG